MNKSFLPNQVHRLIASRFPTVDVFETITEAEDLEAMVLLEGWTNDRISRSLGKLFSMPREDWVVGQGNSTIIMAPFCHTLKGGGRFHSEDIGAWYASLSIETAIHETAYHSSKKLEDAGCLYKARIQMRELITFPHCDFIDLRDKIEEHPDLYDESSYTESQKFATNLRGKGENGILFDSVRHKGGANVVVFKPKLLPPVTQGQHFEYRWHGSQEPDIICLSNQPKLACVG